MHDMIPRKQTMIELPKGKLTFGCQGFNGQEKDDEIYGEGASYTADFWQYDSRLGRRWNVDPLLKPWESPYAAFANNPINVIDPDGEDGIPKPASQRKIDRVNRKIKEKTKVPLFDLKMSGASSSEIRLTSASMTQKFQNRRWFRTFFSDKGIETVVPRQRKSGGTNWDHVDQVVINPYPIRTSTFNTSSARPANEDMVNSGSTGISGTEESTVSVTFSPFGVPNSISVYTINSDGERVNLLKSEMIANEVVKVDIPLGESSAGEIFYEIENTLNKKEIDNWNLEISVSTPVFDPEREISRQQKEIEFKP